MQDARASAIELNIYYLPGDPSTPGRDVEQRYVDVLRRVKAAVTVPVAVKLGPYFSSAGEIALRLDDASADGLVLFNRFLQPDIDLETLAIVPSVALSNPVDASLPRTWITLLRGRVRAALAATTGVEDPADVAKYLVAGADVVMTTSALLRHGPQHATVLLDGLSAWMARKGFGSVDELRGMLSVPPGTDAAAYERVGYVTGLRAANVRACTPVVRLEIQRGTLLRYPRRLQDSMTNTSSVRGPWTPSTRTSSMSTVADGPDTRVIGRPSAATLASATTLSGTDGTMSTDLTTHRW